MCDCRDDEEEDAAALPAGVSAGRLAARTREVERRRGGEAVPEALWAIFFGEASGTIPWRHHERMLSCRTAALGMMRMSPARTKVAACPVCAD